jgi:hypothetical protein
MEYDRPRFVFAKDREVIDALQAGPVRGVEQGSTQLDFFAVTERTTAIRRYAAEHCELNLVVRHRDKIWVASEETVGGAVDA